MKEGEFEWIQKMIFSIEKGGFIFADVIDRQTQEITAAYASPDLSEMKFVKGSKSVKIMNYNTKQCSFHQCLFIGNLVYSTFTFRPNGINFNKENLRKLIGLLEADDSIAHKAIRILYILVASDFEDLMKLGLEKFGYQYWNYPKELDPLALALRMNKISMLDVIADYLKEQESMNLTESNLLLGLKSSSLKFKLLVAERLMGEGAASYDLENALPKHESDFLLHLRSQNFLKADNFKKFIQKHKDRYDETSGIKVNYATTCLRSEWRISSPLVIELMEILSDAEEEVITSELKYLVLVFWKTNRFKLTVFSIMYWIYTIITTVIIIWCYKKEFCESITFGGLANAIIYFSLVAILVLDYIFLLAYEFIVMFTQGKKYFASSDNYIDLMGYAAFIPTVFLLNAEFISPENSFVNFLLTIYILFLGWRSITQMRVFDGMRYLIRVLTQVGLDMREFMKLLTLAIIFFAAVETILNRTT